MNISEYSYQKWVEAWVFHEIDAYTGPIQTYKLYFDTSYGLLVPMVSHYPTGSFEQLTIECLCQLGNCIGSLLSFLAYPQFGGLGQLLTQIIPSTPFKIGWTLADKREDGAVCYLRQHDGIMNRAWSISVNKYPEYPEVLYCPN